MNKYIKDAIVGFFFGSGLAYWFVVFPLLILNHRR